MRQRDKLVVGNWKMHGGLTQNAALLRDVVQGLDISKPGRASCAVCCPFPYLAQTQSTLTGSTVAWGAQNVSEHARGAYTGEVSVDMLADFSCRYVIVGHSERRALFGESSEIVAAKAERAIRGGIVPIVCVGETIDDREAGRTEQVVASQLAAVLSRLGAGAEAPGQPGFVLAYEPVWAIGTGRNATPGQAQEVHFFLRRQVAQVNPDLATRLQVLYGGSVKAENAASLFSMPDIDGGLIGGASLLAEEFLAIVNASTPNMQELI